MEIFDQLAAMGHERVLLCSNPDVGLRAIIAVHSTVLGPGLGGVRMWPFATLDEALTDVLRLSRGMTYKAAAAGPQPRRRQGGDHRRPQEGQERGAVPRLRRLRRLAGRPLHHRRGRRHRPEDMELIHMETRWVTGVSPELGGAGDPSPVTAFGVWQGMRAAAQWTWGDAALRGRSVAIQGLGSVGCSLAAATCSRRGPSSSAPTSTPSARRARSTSWASSWSPPEQIFDAECDVFAPCALGAVLNAETVPAPALPRGRRRRQQPARRRPSATARRWPRAASSTRPTS